MGLGSEYRNVTKFVEGLAEELKLPRQRIAIIPGNHDIKYLKWTRNATVQLRRMYKDAKIYPLKCSISGTIKDFSLLNQFVQDLEYKIWLENKVIFNWQSVADKIPVDELKRKRKVDVTLTAHERKD